MYKNTDNISAGTSESLSPLNMKPNTIATAASNNMLLVLSE